MVDELCVAVKGPFCLKKGRAVRCPGPLLKVNVACGTVVLKGTPMARSGVKAAAGLLHLRCCIAVAVPLFWDWGLRASAFTSKEDIRRGKAFGKACVLRWNVGILFRQFPAREGDI
jgi:hypothetical protein